MYLPLVALVLFSTATVAETQSTSRLIDTIIGAKPLDRAHPTFPTIAAKRGQEGWVKLSFVIDKQGKVIEPLIEDSSGISQFEGAAIRTAKKWKYSPATKNGEAIEQCKNTVLFSFNLDGTKGVTRKFYSKYKKISTALHQDDLTTARKLLNELKEKKLWNLSENEWYWFGEADYARKSGNKRRELNALNRAAHGGEKTLGVDNHSIVLQKKFLLELDSFQYANALETITRIKNSSVSEEIKNKYIGFENKLKAYIKGNSTLARTLTVGTRGQVKHSLSRNRFQLNDIQGSLKEVEIRCENKRSRYTADDVSVWKIPETWGECAVFVQGQHNTKFSILELPNQV